MTKGTQKLVETGKSQTQIAKELGTVPSMVSRVMRDERVPGVTFRRAALEAYGIDWGDWDDPDDEVATEETATDAKGSA